MQVTASSNREPEPLALDAFERLGAFVLHMEEAPDAVELSVALVDDDEMTHLNEQYRGIVGPTDVDVTIRVRRPRTSRSPSGT